MFKKSYIYFFWSISNTFRIIYNYSFFPIVKEGRLHIFADWAYVIKNSICNNLGIDILKPNTCVGENNLVFNKIVGLRDSWAKK